MNYLDRMKISIITVSLNNASTIGETIASVSSQQYDQIEHIIIDGGSTDGTVQIIERNADRIAYWVSEPDQGIYDAMNKGLGIASGDIIGFLNADDVYASDTVLARIAEAFIEKNIDACYTDLVYVSQLDVNRVVRYWRSCPYREGLFARGWCPPHPTFFVRKHIYEQYGGFDLDYSIGNDIEMMMRLLVRHRIRSQYLPGITVKMRAGGTSNQNLRNIYRQNVEIVRAARNNGIPITIPSFVVSKILSRLKQFLSRPKQDRPQ